MLIYVGYSASRGESGNFFKMIVPKKNKVRVCINKQYN